MLLELEIARFDYNDDPVPNGTSTRIIECAGLCVGKGRLANHTWMHALAERYASDGAHQWRVQISRIVPERLKDSPMPEMRYPQGTIFIATVHSDGAIELDAPRSAYRIGWPNGRQSRHQPTRAHHNAALHQRCMKDATMALSSIQVADIVERLTNKAQARIADLDKPDDIHERRKVWFGSANGRKLKAFVLAKAGITEARDRIGWEIHSTSCFWDRPDYAPSFTFRHIEPGCKYVEITVDDITDPLPVEPPDELMPERNHSKACKIREACQHVILSPAGMLSLIRLRWVPDSKNEIIPDHLLTTIFNDYIDAKVDGVCRR